MPNTPQTLPGTVQSAPSGLLGFDIDTPITSAQAQQFKNAGYDFCCRYLPRNSNPTDKLTNAEAANILNAGLALVAVQHVSAPGWVPNTNLGTVYGNYAATYASQVVGLPPGMNIWCDLEGVAIGTPVQDVVAYCQAWYYAAHTAGYVPGIYVGYDTILTDQQLYNDISFQHSWRAYNGPQVATRGFQLIQGPQKLVNGFNIDPDTTQNDSLGDALLWLSI